MRRSSALLPSVDAPSSAESRQRRRPMCVRRERRSDMRGSSLLPDRASPHCGRRNCERRLMVIAAAAASLNPTRLSVTEAARAPASETAVVKLSTRWRERWQQIPDPPPNLSEAASAAPRETAKKSQQLPQCSVLLTRDPSIDAALSSLSADNRKKARRGLRQPYPRRKPHTSTAPEVSLPSISDDQQVENPSPTVVDNATVAERLRQNCCRGVLDERKYLKGICGELKARFAPAPGRAVDSTVTKLLEKLNLLNYLLTQPVREKDCCGITRLVVSELVSLFSNYALNGVVETACRLQSSDRVRAAARSDTFGSKDLLVRAPRNS